MMSYGPDAFCFDLNAWCRGIKATALSKYTTDLVTEDIGKTWVSSSALCYVAEEMLNQTTAVLVATGTFKITHDGTGGPATKIDLNADLDHVSMAVADATAIASTEAVATTEAYAYTDTETLCNYLSSNDGWASFLCSDTEASSQVLGVARAQGISSGYASAQAGGFGNQKMNVVVEGEDIRKFSALVTASAGTFAFADAQATVDAIADAFLVASATSFAETCYNYVQETCAMTCIEDDSVVDKEMCIQMWCSVESCDFAYATDSLNTTALGQSLGHSIGLSFEESSFNFMTMATYEHSFFTEIEDQIFFGYEGQGYSGADATVSCTTPSTTMSQT